MSGGTGSSNHSGAKRSMARGTSIPVATGERLTTKWEFARVIEHRAASILQPDLGRSGGILETKKIAAMAEAHHIQVAPHCYCGPIVAAANIQLATTLPNFLILESIKQWDGFHADLLRKKIEWQDGWVIPSKEPGLGVELDEAVCEANPWNGGPLHLQMAPDPLFP
jgi:L-alanine-DL-glutamate epimerase-like enolase superfamily enzyme